MQKFLRTILGPLLLISACPPLVILLWYTNSHLNGSLSQLGTLIVQQGFFSSLYQIWQPVFFGSTTAWKIIFFFVSFELILVRFLPGKIFYGPISPKGNIPIYKANGLLAFAVTIGLFGMGGFYFHSFSPVLIYDNLGAIFGALNCLSLVLCLVLYLKGRFFPSSSDSGVTGNFIFDYYWGTELYPQLGSINLKMFINCRLGMMSWGLLLLCYVAAQQSRGGISNAIVIATVLQFIYITKFFIWETGYLASLDIMHDRAGFYICWGCLVWVPCVYTSPTMYLVNHPHNLSFAVGAFLFIAGALAITINYLADRQRQKVRLTGGNCSIWGKKPRTMLANYYTDSGQCKQNLLLSSGWWGISRHFHYVPEIAAAFFWSAPALFENFSPYFYVVFLSILLVDRAFRDDARCAKKYGSYWQIYCKLVPYKIIPYVV